MLNKQLFEIIDSHPPLHVVEDFRAITAAVPGQTTDVVDLVLATSTGPDQAKTALRIRLTIAAAEALATELSQAIHAAKNPSTPTTMQ